MTTNLPDAAPVARLLTIGDNETYDPADWPDYVAAYGLGRDDIPALIRMACDPASNQADGDAAWASVHAWRALGQLRAHEAVAPLLASLKSGEDFEIADEELPAVFGMIGPAALPPIADFLSDRSVPMLPAATAMAALKEIAARHPDCRDECVRILVQVLEPDAASDPTTNGFVVAALIDLAAVEAIDAIRQALRRGAVDISIPGDEEDVEIALGLREHRATPKPRYHILPPGWPEPPAATDLYREPQIPIRSEKIGRNEPCPCGSGKKYKKCCMP